MNIFRIFMRFELIEEFKCNWEPLRRESNWTKRGKNTRVVHGRAERRAETPPERANTPSAFLTVKSY